MLLLTDGTVMVQENQTANWWRLTPDGSGSYVNGTWSQLASMPAGYAPKYYASAVLPDGRVLVEGGEYLGTSDTIVESNLGAIYDPVADKWTSVDPPSGWTEIGDAPGVVLANGQFMMGNIETTGQALFNATKLTWQAVGTGKADKNSEEGWSLLPNGKVLTVDVNNGRESEVFTPSTGAWTSAGTLPVTLPFTDNPQAYGNEIGPQILRPNGTLLATGATPHTAIYDTGTGVWSAGPDFPTGVSADGPAAVLPNGHVLIPSSPFFDSPEHFYDFNGSSFALVSDTPSASVTSSFVTRMLLIPTGQVLVSDGASIYVYTDSGSPDASWRPTITSVPTTLNRSTTYTVSGTQLNGLTESSAYGDDNQDSTNYPLVRITNTASGHVYYARTSDMSSMSVQPGAASSAKFTMPANAELGGSTLRVVANGIASAATNVNVSAPPNFSVSASPTSLTVLQGSSGKSTITTSVSGGFNNAISLSASGLPAGVTASFSPASIAAPGSGSSLLTLTTSATATVGTKAITITGSGGSLTRTTTLSLTVSSPTSNLLSNAGFENGANTAPWVSTANVVSDNTQGRTSHSGSWYAWLNGTGNTHTDTLYQQVAIPSGVTSATLSFWLHIDTAESASTAAVDTMKVQIRNASNSVLGTLATYSNRNPTGTGYTRKVFDVTKYAGKTIRVYFLGLEDSSLQTSFVVDDAALTTGA
jgi:hypothetical protein